ncbi:hypothetical protein ACFPYJ_07725 [Paenibacillus solisilvae]|uniref:Pycsar effector protein domain-containing protein n=1 Tax=Paenibacillus solisilvae TaxID=2486751 RepID=A0ABW0VVV3_9BACL
MNNENNVNSIEILYKALEDTQNTIRFTDTKAGGVLVLSGVLAAFLSTISKDYLKYLKNLLDLSNTHHWGNFFHFISLLIFSAASVLLITAVYLALKSISPKSGPIDSIQYDMPSRVPNLFYLFELSPAVNILNVFTDKAGYFKLRDKTSMLLTAVNGLSKEDIKTLLIFELQKVSYIRELKMQRVKRSIHLLLWSCFSFLVLGIFSSVIYLYS